MFKGTFQLLKIFLGFARSTKYSKCTHFYIYSIYIFSLIGEGLKVVSHLECNMHMNVKINLKSTCCHSIIIVVCLIERNGEKTGVQFSLLRFLRGVKTIIKPVLTEVSWQIDWPILSPKHLTTDLWSFSISSLLPWPYGLIKFRIVSWYAQG